jgi:hypothetical protein
MYKPLTGNRFYQGMGVLLLSLVVIGFGLAALIRQQSPLDLPITFHMHAAVYLAWFGLFIFQASLIGNNNKALHMKLGQLSIILVIGMVLMGWIMAQSSFNRGISPIPDISIQQFMAFPVFDLFGLLLFYSLALFKRFDAEFHKRAILFASIAIMDPATARIGYVIDVAPFPIIASLLLVAAVIWHDRKVLSRVHIITWFGLLWVFLRVGFVFGFAATDLWANIANALFA